MLKRRRNNTKNNRGRAFIKAFDSAPFNFTSICPECGTALERNEGEAAWFCPNDMKCPPQIRGKIEHFISRKAMNIDSLCEGKIELLYDKGLITDVQIYILSDLNN